MPAKGVADHGQGGEQVGDSDGERRCPLPERCLATGSVARRVALSMRPIGQAASPRRHLAPEDSDPGFAQRRRRFVDGLERAIMEANREIIGRTLGRLDDEAFLRLAVRVAELRAGYIAHGLSIAQGHPDQAAIEQLAAHRRAYEEMLHVFEATERVVERGYVELPA
jgi:hypothetical protein